MRQLFLKYIYIYIILLLYICNYAEANAAAITLSMCNCYKCLGVCLITIVCIPILFCSRIKNHLYVLFDVEFKIAEAKAVCEASR